MSRTLVSKGLLTLSVVGLALANGACSDDENITGAPSDNSIIGTAAAAGDFSILLTAIEAAGLTATLQSGGPFTVFAPTDDAFNALPAGTLDALLADTEALTQVLLYHVTDGKLSADQVRLRSSLETLQGQPLIVTEGSVLVNGVPVRQQDIATDNGFIHVIGEVLLPPELDLLETAASTETFSTLVAAVQAAGLVDVLKEGIFTVFAPTDEAFAKLPDGTVEALLADPTALARVLTHHLVPGRVFARDLSGVVSTTTAAGYPVLFDLTDGAKINEANITATNILATNGVVHVIDEVLLPPAGDIVETAVEAGFSTLATALTAAGLVDELKDGGPFTVFAPTDAAFAALPAGVLNDLLQPENQSQLRQVLLYHVVGSRVFSGELTDGATPATLQGSTVTVDLTNGVKVNASNVTAVDIIAKNGVIHVIDAVLLPPAN